MLGAEVLVIRVVYFEAFVWKVKKVMVMVHHVWILTIKYY